jgi:preprotein translocase subunit SecG
MHYFIIIYIIYCITLLLLLLLNKDNNAVKASAGHGALDQLDPGLAGS